MAIDLESKSKLDISETLIDFDGPDDPYNALNWPMRKKVVTTLLYSLLTMGGSFASTIYNSGISQIDAQFHVSTEVSLLGLTLYLLGNGAGPLLWAPMSEAFGRKLSVVLPMSALMIFSFASATAKDLQTLLITRFFGGVFGSAPICNGGGVLADIWPAHQRGAAMMVWGLGVIVGPLSAPTVGAALVVNLDKTGWRWTEYLTGILLAAILIPSFVFIDESYPPVLLGRKASQIRHETKNWAVRSKSQESQLTVQEVSRKYLIVPIEMLIDPICFLISLYAAFVYAVIYLAIPAFPIEFQEVRHWNAVRGSLPFFATIIGTFIAGGILLWGQKMYITRLVANNNKVVPEARLFPMMVGSFFFPAGLFIMGWTSDADIHWIGWCFGAMCLGLGFFTIFQSALTYMVDTYLMLAASALAANMFLRSVLAGTFPLFANALLHNLGLNWGMSLLGFISAAMIPIPFLFYIYGKRIRAMGKRSKMSFVA